MRTPWAYGCILAPGLGVRLEKSRFAPEICGLTAVVWTLGFARGGKRVGLRVGIPGLTAVLWTLDLTRGWKRVGLRCVRDAWAHGCLLALDFACDWKRVGLRARSLGLRFFLGLTAGIVPLPRQLKDLV